MPLLCIQKDSRIKVSSLERKTGRKPKTGTSEEAGQGSAEPEPTDAKRTQVSSGTGAESHRTQDTGHRTQDTGHRTQLKPDAEEEERMQGPQSIEHQPKKLNWKATVAWDVQA